MSAPGDPLSRFDDRRTLATALGAAAATLVVVLGIVAVPAIDACAADPRGIVTCLRDLADRRFKLPGEVAQHAAPPAAVLPAPDLAPIADAKAAPIKPASPAALVPLAAPPPAQGGPYMPPTPERVADLRPEPVKRLPLPDTSSRPIPEPVLEIDTHASAVAPAEAATAFPPTDLAPPLALEFSPQVEAAVSAAAPLAALVEFPPPEVTAELAVGTAPVAAIMAAPGPTTIAALPEPAAPSLAAPPAPAIVASPKITIAAGAEAPASQSTQPGVAAPVALAPTIDAIELDGPRSFISGSGPAGALMRLFADDEVVGESPVEAGRWLVETGPLLTSPKRELKVEAVDPDTGRSLGQSTITVEVQLPADDPVFDQDPPEDPEAETPPSSEDPAQQPSSGASPQGSLPAGTSTTAVAAVPAVPSAQPAAPSIQSEPGYLPELLATQPERETASVTILGKPEASPSIDTLPSRKPALVAEFELPRPRGEPVELLELIPFGDPVDGRYTGGKAIIRRGDTLWTIAHRYYGAGIHYRTIFEANRDQIRRPSRIFPGQIFDLPLVTDE